MPELPEVQTIVNTLQPRLPGRTIGRVRLYRQDIVHPDGTDLPALLHGRSFAGITRRGKKIILRLDDERRFYIHLGMTGRLTLEAALAPLLPHTHLVIELPGDKELRFHDPRRFGGIWWLDRDQPADIGLGPEPLEITAVQLAAGLSRTKRAVKSALLDQALLAGLGNIYADEALFAAKIHPLKTASKLTEPEIRLLTRQIKLVLNRALKHKGSTLRDYRNADGEPGNFQNLHRVYDRAGQPCHNCRAAVVRLVISGRSAHFCPKCQPRRAKSR
jgi:formamidopyrimidine-DNA glycosylase